MATDDQPLLDLFMRLREAGLRLGIDEYQLMLRALRTGFGQSDGEALVRLCCTLWAKSAEEELLVKHHFQQVLLKPASPPLPITSPPPVQPDNETKPTHLNKRYLVAALMAASAGLLGVIAHYLIRAKGTLPGQTPGTNDGNPLSSWIVGIALLLSLASVVYVLYRWIKGITAPSSISRLTTVLPDSPSPAPRRKKFTGSPLPAELMRNMEDENQVVQAARKAIRRDDEMPIPELPVTSDYLPVTRRQMQQSWRHLRLLAREGALTEIDLEATVDQIGRRGLFLKPVLVPRLVNRTELLLLIDRDGSMVPFHSLSARLAETARLGGRLSRADIYYFHNCPYDYLYRDPAHLEAESVNDILFRCRPQNTRVLIFSDAGAARGGLNPERIELTVAFLCRIGRKIRHIAWLNPMPRSRWIGTTAGEIARLVPMFEFNRRGLEDAIGILRGSSKQYLKF